MRRKVNAVDRRFGGNDAAGVQHGAVVQRGTSGNVSDVVEANTLLYGDETEVFSDVGYQGAHKRPDVKGVNWNVAVRSTSSNGLTNSPTMWSASRPASGPRSLSLHVPPDSTPLRNSATGIA